MTVAAVETVTCIVGRIGPDGPWIGFAPSVDDGYQLVVERGSVVRRASADDTDLLCLAIAYFEDELGEPPERLAATHADIGSLVRHVAERTEPEARAVLAQAVDAIDDGLAGDAVIAALTRCLPPGTDPLGRLGRRAREAIAGA